MVMACFCLSAQSNLHSQDQKKEDKETKVQLEQKIEPVVSANSKEVKANYSTSNLRKLKIGADEIEYKVETGMLPVQLDKDKKGDVFFTSYIVSPKPGENRPVTFCFNGGPGSSSTWLHLGGLSPKRIRKQDAANSKPFILEDNTSSILDLTDLVFIDPISTGFSRALKDEAAKNFHHVDNDVVSVGEFIRIFVTRNKRWSSAKYICGESYGGVRGAALSQHLLSEHNMELAGLVFVSPAIDFQTLSASGSNELPYVMFLPSFTATAFYHKKLAPEYLNDLPSTLKKAESFAQGIYAKALLMGDAAPKKLQEKVVQEMSSLTGLSQEYIKKADMRVSMGMFSKELMREEHMIVGRYDSRFTGKVRSQTKETYDFDPSGEFISGQFGAGINHYFYEDLGVESDLPYKVVTSAVHPWNYDRFRGSYVDLSPSLKEAMLNNPHMKVLNLCGYTDLATPYLANRYTMNHLLLPEEIQQNISYAYYLAGHMMYLHD